MFSVFEFESGFYDQSASKTKANYVKKSNFLKGKYNEKHDFFYISGNFFSHISHVVFFDICGKNITLNFVVTSFT